MPDAARPQEFLVSIQASQSPPPAVAANVCLVNRIGQTFVLDFGFLDPLMLAESPAAEGVPRQAAHTSRIVIAQDVAIKLRDLLNRTLGAA